MSAIKKRGRSRPIRDNLFLNRDDGPPMREAIHERVTLAGQTGSKMSRKRIAEAAGVSEAYLESLLPEMSTDIAKLSRVLEVLGTDLNSELARFGFSIEGAA